MKVTNKIKRKNQNSRNNQTNNNNRMIMRLYRKREINKKKTAKINRMRIYKKKTVKINRVRITKKDNSNKTTNSNKMSLEEASVWKLILNIRCKIINFML